MRTFISGNGAESQHGAIPPFEVPPSRSTAAPAEECDDVAIDGNADDDLINQRVKQPVRLKGDDVETARRKENQAAIGGMRNPRLSTNRGGRHKTLGKMAFDIISHIVWHDAAIEQLVFQALGGHDKAAQGSICRSHQESSSRPLPRFQVEVRRSTSG